MFSSNDGNAGDSLRHIRLNSEIKKTRIKGTTKTCIEATLLTSRLHLGAKLRPWRLRGLICMLRNCVLAGVHTCGQSHCGDILYKPWYFEIFDNALTGNGLHVLGARLKEERPVGVTLPSSLLSSTKRKWSTAVRPRRWQAPFFNSYCRWQHAIGHLVAECVLFLTIVVNLTVSVNIRLLHHFVHFFVCQLFTQVGHDMSQFCRTDETVAIL